MTPTLTIATTTVREDDLRQHVEDELTITVTRNGKRVQVRWNDLTPSERTKYCPRNSKGYLMPPRTKTPVITTSWLPMR